MSTAYSRYLARREKQGGGCLPVAGLTLSLIAVFSSLGLYLSARSGMSGDHGLGGALLGLALLLVVIPLVAIPLLLGTIINLTVLMSSFTSEARRPYRLLVLFGLLMNLVAAAPIVVAFIPRM